MEYKKALDSRIDYIGKKFDVNQWHLDCLKGLIAIQTFADVLAHAKKLGVDSDELKHLRETMSGRLIGSRLFEVTIFPEAEKYDEEQLATAFSGEIGHMIYRYFCLRRGILRGPADPDLVVSEIYDYVGMLYGDTNYPKELVTSNYHAGKLWISLDGSVDEFLKTVDQIAEEHPEEPICKYIATDARHYITHFGIPAHQLASYYFFQLLGEVGEDYDKLLPAFNSALINQNIPLDDYKTFVDNLLKDV